MLTSADFGQGRAKAQAVSRRPLTAKVRVRSQVHVVLRGGQSGSGTVPLPALGFSVVTVIPPTNRPHLHLDSSVRGQGRRFRTLRQRNGLSELGEHLDRKVLPFYVSFRNTELMVERLTPTQTNGMR